MSQPANNAVSSQPKQIITTQDELTQQFNRMHELSRSMPVLTWSARERQLDNLNQMLSAYKDAFADAISKDFGQRSIHETQIAELVPCFQAIRHAKKHGKNWMKPKKVGVSALFLPASNEIQPQPLGVVGIIVPWNYPLSLAVNPLLDALTAGNRVLIKMSEHAPLFARRFADAVSEYFSADMVSVVLGEADMAEAFCQLLLDHLLFTGSTNVGRKVMAAAAPNLTPVTLELGGKSPVVVLEDADLENAVGRIMMGKLLNAGQTCLAPDYVLLHRKHHKKFIELAKDWVATHYPNLGSTPDYTRIINDAQYQRIQGYLDELGERTAEVSDSDARNGSKGQIVPLTDTDAQPEIRLMPPLVITEPALDTKVMQEELFAPLLPLVHCEDVHAAIKFVNGRPRPLALYVFGQDSSLIEKVRTQTVSGGMCINETLLHVAQHELPFGGVGESGMGAYHGEIGFLRLSHQKAVFIQSKLNGANLLLPPYNDLINKALGFLLK